MSDHLEKLRAKFPDKKDVHLELMCAKRANIVEMTGLSPHQHRLNAMRLLCPDKVEHAWRIKMVESWHETRTVRKLQELSWMGSAMSNKTTTLADLLLTLFWEEPDNTTILVASPSKGATEGRLWAEILKTFRAATRKWELPGRLNRSRGSITLGEDDLRAGIFMVPLDDHGKLIGANNPNVTSGKLIVAVDELPNIPNNASELLNAVNNLKMRPSFTLIAAGNFAEVDDGMGIVCEPRASGGYSSLDPESDFEWETKRNGRVYRFDGMQSPNVIAQEDIYPFLTRWAVVKEYIDAGQTDTADFMRWIRSFPVIGLEEKTITNRVKIDLNKADTDPIWSHHTLRRGVSVDPGFGGDPCVMQPMTLGRLAGQEIMTLDFHSPPITIPIRLTQQGREKQAEAERQIVAFVKDYCVREGIAPEDVIFDGSMRSGIVQAFNGWSGNVLAVDFGGQASDRQKDAITKKPWREEVANFVTELWMAMGDAIMSGQIRGLQRANKAAAQLCKRKWKWSGRKKQIIPKDDYKAANQGQSPNEADAVVLSLEWARRHGFMIAGVGAKQRMTAESISEILERQMKLLPKRASLDIGGAGAIGRLERFTE